MSTAHKPEQVIDQMQVSRWGDKLSAAPRSREPAEPIETVLGRIELKVKERTQDATASAEAKSAQRAAIRRELRMNELRSMWNAPERHASKKVIIGQGGWSDSLRKVQLKLGTGMIIALVGIRGNGKTQLAVEAMRHATACLNAAYFTTATQLFTRIKNSYRQDSTESEQKIMESMRKFKLLVIDEIGKRSETAWENNLLFDLINQRYNDQTDTIIIDNNAPEKLQEAIGASLARRINETGGVINCTWEAFK